MKLSDILNTISIPLEHDKVKFALIPMSSATIDRWNNIYSAGAREGESSYEYTRRVKSEQCALLAEHLRACVVDGEKKRVTGKWVATELPQPILQSLAEFFVEGKQPEWAAGGDEGK